MIRASDWLFLPFLLLFVLLELAVVPHFLLLGQTPNLLFLLALAWGLVGGIEVGLMWAFFAGIFLDLFSIAPVGSTALIYIVAVWLLTKLVRWLPESGILLPSLIAVTGTMFVTVAQWILLQLMQFNVRLPAFQNMLLLLLVHALLMLPLHWVIMRWHNLIHPPSIQ